jgi:Tfp pilus assembly protein PilF
MLATRRFALRTLALSAAGGVAYLGIRVLIDLPLPMGAAAVEAPVAALGGVAVRGIELAILPNAADALPQLEPSFFAGVVVLIAAVAAFALLRGRPALGAFMVPLPILLPSVAASADSGMVGDRFFYLAFAGLVVAIGVGCSRIVTRMPRVAVLASLLVPVLALGTWVRVSDWTSNRSLFGASLERDPQNPHAAYRVGREFHVRDGDCLRAIPFYRASQGVEPRAGNNLQACLLAIGKVEEAVAMGAALIERDSYRATPAANTARGLIILGRPQEAEVWARRALTRTGNRSGALSLLGTSLGQQGRYREALAAFQDALSLDADDSIAKAGIKIAKTRLRDASSKTSP